MTRILGQRKRLVVRGGAAGLVALAASDQLYADQLAERQSTSVRPAEAWPPRGSRQRPAHSLSPMRRVVSATMHRPHERSRRYTAMLQ
jgi:hypothetical protein